MGRQASYEARGKILAGALLVFGDKGYKEATVREIARISGVAVGGLYPYFGSKEQLYAQVLREEMTRYNERIRDLEHADPETGIRRYIEHHIEYTASKKALVARHFKDYDLGFVKPVTRRFFAHQKEFLEAIIRRGAKKRVFATGDAGEAALFILCLLKGALFYDLAGSADLGRWGDSLCGLVLAFLKGGQRADGARAACAGSGKRSGR